MILTLAMLLFQFPVVGAVANTSQPLPARPVVESAVSAPTRPLGDGKSARILETPAPSSALPLTPTLGPVAARPADEPIIEPPTSFLNAEIYNPPSPQLFYFEEPTAMHPKVWLLLGAAEHTSATFDAWSTRRALEAGRIEADPIMRPFASSAAMYAAIQVIPIGLDYLARRLQRSSGWTRHVWWAPQSIATATFLFSGSYNVAHTP